jgi:hypothetical protein
MPSVVPGPGSLRRTPATAVHDRAHRNAEPRVPKEQVEHDRRADTDRHDDQLVVTDLRLEQRHGLGGEKCGKWIRVGRVPERADRDHDEHQPDRRHDLRRSLKRGKPPGKELQTHTEDGSEDSEAQHGCDAPWHAVLHVQEVEDEDRQGRDRAVREIEDSRRLVRQHETHAGKAVDRARSQPDDDVRQER